MRELHIQRMNMDDGTIVLVDPETDEEFCVAADEQWDAAVRGDLPALRRSQSTQTSSMHPSEIQELIRGGASVDDIQQRAGMHRHRLDNLARPILMERANMVTRAQHSHPVLAQGPSDITLEMAIHTGLSTLGVSYSDSSWDSWKTPEGHWIIELRWTQGHATNTAHWRFQQDRATALTSPLDEAASNLVDPDASLRRPHKVASISQLGEARIRHSAASEETRSRLALAAQRDAAGVPDGSHACSVRRTQPAYSPSVTVALDDLTSPTAPATPPSGTAESARPRISPLSLPTPGHSEGGLRPPSPVASPYPVLPSEKDDDSQHKGRKKIPMPSWEDVLLGVRGQQHE